MTLILLDPFRIPAGGPSYDADVQAMLDARAAAGDPTSAPYALAISNLVTGIKAVSGFWDDIIQLVVLAGATTVAGARLSIKGLNLTNNNFLDADIGIKTGSKGNAIDKYWATGYSGTVAGTGQNDFHVYGYFTELHSSTTASYCGQGGIGNGSMHLRQTASRFRSSTADNHTAQTIAGAMGLNRNSSTEYERLLDNGSLSTVTRTSQAPNSAPIYIQAGSGNGNTTPSAWSSSRMLIWALGSGCATLDNYKTPVDNFIAALAAI